MEINLLAKERVGKLEGRNSSVQYEVEEEGSDNFLVTPPWRYAPVSNFKSVKHLVTAAQFSMSRCTWQKY